MSEKDNGLNWFKTTIMVLLGALLVFGLFITLKLLRAAAPSVEKAIKNSNRMVEQNTEVETKSTPETTTTTTITTASGTSFVVQNINIDTWNKLGNTSTEKEDESYDELTEQEETEQAEQPKQEETAQTPAEEFSYTLEDVSDGQPAPAPKKTAPAPAKPKPAEPKRENILTGQDYSYLEGIARCRQEKIFPCKWRDGRQELKKQYHLNNPLGPVERLTFTKAGKVLTRTLATLDGTVMYYQGAFAELYFSEGVLTRIRTFPYDNPNLRDWFVIDQAGRLATCLCGMPTQDCCGRSMLYREGGHRKYCELFPMDTDFCTK